MVYSGNKTWVFGVLIYEETNNTLGNSNKYTTIVSRGTGERGLQSMPKKGELSKTARASLANREEVNHLTARMCAKCGEAIMLKELQPVKVLGKGMVYYHKGHYNVQ